MTPGRLRALLASATLALASCGAPTQLVVVIGTDLNLPSDADQITLTIEGAADADASSAPMPIELPLANGMPSGGWTLGVRPRPGASRVIIRADARLRTAAVVSTVVDTTFRTGETRYVPVLLSSRCAALRCPTGLVCDANRGCVEPTVVDASTLPTAAPCAPGTERCGTQCVDTSSSASNCGACGRPCTAMCQQGVCSTDRVTQLVAGARHTCARTARGKMFCWGALGTSEVRQPAWVSIENVSQMASGREHVCAIADTGNRDTVRCWGNNATRQLGPAMPAMSAAPVQLTMEALADMAPRHIGAGATHTCATVGATSGGQLRCWGLNDRRQVTTTATEPTGPLSPMQAGSLSDAVRVATGDNFTCFTRGMSSDFAIFCFGDNTRGQCGASGTNPISGSAEINGLRGAPNLVAGAQHACARAADGRTACWGDNRRGQLGSGSGFEMQSTAQWLDGQQFKSIYAGAANSCGLDQDDRLFCWGDNTRRWLFGTEAERVATQTRVSSLAGRVASVAIGAGPAGPSGAAPTHICVALESGLVYCWGDNEGGHLGVGSDARLVPAPRLVVPPPPPP